MAKLKKSKLSKEQILFCQEFIKDHKAEEACVRAGCSIDTAEETAKQYLSDEEVIDYISKSFNKRIQQHVTEVKKEIEKIKHFYFLLYWTDILNKGR